MITATLLKFDYTIATILTKQLQFMYLNKNNIDLSKKKLYF